METADIVRSFAGIMQTVNTVVAALSTYELNMLFGLPFCLYIVVKAIGTFFDYPWPDWSFITTALKASLLSLGFWANGLLVRDNHLPQEIAALVCLLLSAISIWWLTRSLVHSLKAETA